MKEEIVCRCKELTKDKIIEVIKKGAKDVDAVKRATGAGMGLCQGRTCSWLISRIISEETGRPLSESRPATVRVPLRPIPVKVLVEDKEYSERRRNKR